LIDQNLGKNDDFHVTEFWSKLVSSREFRVSHGFDRNAAKGTIIAEGVS
jgi:hypothetical protein